MELAIKWGVSSWILDHCGPPIIRWHFIKLCPFVWDLMVSQHRKLGAVRRLFPIWLSVQWALIGVFACVLVTFEMNLSWELGVLVNAALLLPRHISHAVSDSILPPTLGIVVFPSLVHTFPHPPPNISTGITCTTRDGPAGVASYQHGMSVGLFEYIALQSLDFAIWIRWEFFHLSSTI